MEQRKELHMGGPHEWPPDRRPYMRPRIEVVEAEICRPVAISGVDFDGSHQSATSDMFGGSHRSSFADFFTGTHWGANAGELGGSHMGGTSGDLGGSHSGGTAGDYGGSHIGATFSE